MWQPDQQSTTLLRVIIVMVLTALWALAMAAKSAFGAGFLTNGSFEDGDLTGWSVSVNLPEVLDSTALDYTGPDPFVGDFLLDLVADSELSQNASVPQSCGAAAVRFAVRGSASDAQLNAGWSACGITMSPISTSTAGTWVNQEHWRSGCDETNDTFQVQFTTDSSAVYVDEIEIVCVPGASPSGSGLVTVNVDIPEPDALNPFANLGQGPEPWRAYFRLTILVVYTFIYMLVRFGDNSQFMLLWTLFFTAATWAMESTEAAITVLFLYVVSVIVFQVPKFVQSLTS